MITEYKLKIAKGKSLNRIAEIYGLKRKFLESDKRLRKRIKKFIYESYFMYTEIIIDGEYK